MREIRTSGSMSGDGKRSVAAWPKLPRPSSTLPQANTYSDRTRSQGAGSDPGEGSLGRRLNGRHLYVWRAVDSEGETLRSCAMIITDANELAGELHDRMPVILEPEQFEARLTGAAGLELLKPAANDVLQCWPVSRRVNSSRASDDDASLVEAVATGTSGNAQQMHV
jgi:hypothetical protein